MDSTPKWNIEETRKHAERIGIYETAAPAYAFASQPVAAGMTDDLAGSEKFVNDGRPAYPVSKLV